MSIRLVQDCGSLPTQVVDGNLVILGCDNKIAASIPLPFKKKMNGRLTYEFIRYPNILVFTVVNEDDALVMRYDGSWTIYNKDMIPIYFGNYDKELFLSPYVTVDRFGSYSAIPPRKKKKRLYAAYLIRYTQSDLIHYTAYSFPCVREISGWENEEIQMVLIKGLNIGTEGYPLLEPSVNSLLYEGWLEIPSRDTLCAHPSLQDNIYKTPAMIHDRENICMSRRKAYAEIDISMSARFNPPKYIWDLLDVMYMVQIPTADVGLPQERICYNLAVMMNLYQNLLVGAEVNGITLQFADQYGEVSINQAQDLWHEPINPELKRAAYIQASGVNNCKLCGYVVKKVAEISTPTVLPRLAREGQTLYLNGESIDLGDLQVADKPDPNMAGYQEAVASGGRAVLYLADGSYKII